VKLGVFLKQLLSCICILGVGLGVCWAGVIQVCGVWSVRYIASLFRMQLRPESLIQGSCCAALAVLVSVETCCAVLCCAGVIQVCVRAG